MSTILIENLRAEVDVPLQLHIDCAEMKAANWVFISGWLVGWPQGEVEIESDWPNAYYVTCQRPDVCRALGKEANPAYGFSLHLLTPTPGKSLESFVTLRQQSKVFARFQFELPSTDLQVLPFATPRAIELTKGLYRDHQNKGVIESESSILLPNGVIAPKNFLLQFDNTRIGNYHPDVIQIIAQPGTVALDIGCGLRDLVFDNMVTQDVYPTPTATLITRPGDARLPFVEETFDLIILDSVLEHVPDPVLVLAEAVRVLKPGGRIFGDVPFLQPLHLEPHHYFNFTPYGLGVVAKKAGLTLNYVAAESHQRPEFSLEWLLRRTFDMLQPAEADCLKDMKVGDLFSELGRNKEFIAYPPEGLIELAAGYRFHMIKT